MAKHQIKVVFHKDWIADGTKRFGENRRNWRFVCPLCDYEASAQDWLDLGASQGSIGFACVGRWYPDDKPVQGAFGGQKKKGQPCDYTGGGLFALNPIRVVTDDDKVIDCFNFAEKPQNNQP